MFVVHCPCQKISHARAEITVDGNPVPLTMEQNSDYSYLVKFTPVVAAPHKISFCAMEEHIKTFYKSFQPGTMLLFIFSYEVIIVDGTKAWRRRDFPSLCLSY